MVCSWHGNHVVLAKVSQSGEGPSPKDAISRAKARFDEDPKVAEWDSVLDSKGGSLVLLSLAQSAVGIVLEQVSWKSPGHAIAE